MRKKKSAAWPSRDFSAQAHFGREPYLSILRRGRGRPRSRAPAKKTKTPAAGFPDTGFSRFATMNL
jgi:hypothetical protein